jgi:hypothetical protein
MCASGALVGPSDTADTGPDGAGVISAVADGAGDSVDAGGAIAIKRKNSKNKPTSKRK